MDTTPTRRYFLRSTNRLSEASPLSRFQPGQRLKSGDKALSIRKRRVQTTDEGRYIKRQRTRQCHGLPFLSPDSLVTKRCISVEEKLETDVLPMLDSLKGVTPFGDFEHLPNDVIDDILNRTPYGILGRMALTSKSWKSRILSYAESRSFRIRWLRDIKSLPTSQAVDVKSDPLYATGTFIRLITVHDEFSHSLDLLKAFMCLAYEEKIPMKRLGRMVHAFYNRPEQHIRLEHIDNIISVVFSTIGYLENEVRKIIERRDTNRRPRRTEHLHILCSEMELRKTLLALFVNNGSTNPKFGLNKYFLGGLMKKFQQPIDRDAPRSFGVLPSPLFFLLFAPIRCHNGKEVVHWYRFSQISVNEFDEAKELLPFSRAFGALLECRITEFGFPWSKNTIFNLVEEVTTYPAPWSMNTFVSLQVLEPELVPIGVKARMTRNHEDEAGDMLCTMKMLLHRWKMDVYGVMEGVINSIVSGMSTLERRTLFDRCWNWHQRNIEGFRGRAEYLSEIRLEIESQIEVLPVLMKLL